MLFAVVYFQFKKFICMKVVASFIITILFVIGVQAQSMQELQVLAEQGDADAQFAIGDIHWHGLGVKEDPTEAVRWFRRAAGQDHAGAQYQLGTAHLNGNGVDEDKEEAQRQFSRSIFKLQRRSELGDAEAQYFLGHAIFHGNGIHQDSIKAVEWWRKAAEQGYARAIQSRMGLCLRAWRRPRLY